MVKAGLLALGLACVAAFGFSGPVLAQASGDGTLVLEPTAKSLRPRARPAEPQASPGPQPQPAAAESAAPVAEPAGAPEKTVARDPSKGAVTSLPVPRFVSLKGNEGNARRGPSLTHRIDWVFTTAGMPLRITAEHENWRRVEDAEGMGGWVHYALLSGVRSVLVAADMAEFHDRPDAGAPVAFQAERGVIGRLLECTPEWCRVNLQGEKGWAPKAALWGVLPDEVVD